MAVAATAAEAEAATWVVVEAASTAVEAASAADTAAAPEVTAAAITEAVPTVAEAMAVIMAAGTLDAVTAAIAGGGAYGGRGYGGRSARTRLRRRLWLPWRHFSKILVVGGS